MSTFLGLIEEIPGISVDRFDGENLNSSAYFLSHCHTDHMQGLSPEFFKHLHSCNKYLYCSAISKAFLETKYSSQTCIKDIPIDRRITIEYKDENGSTDILLVTCISAGHCPGSVMFLFDKASMLILYTGDFRINQLDYKKIAPLHFRRDSHVLPKKLTKIYLDTTFLDLDFASLPTRKESINRMYEVVKEWLKKSPRNVVVLECSALYGSEFLYMELSKLLNMRVHVKDCVYQSYCRIPELACHITFDPLITSIHACMRKGDRLGLRCRYDIDEKNVLTIVPSVLKWRGKDTSVIGEWDNSRERTFNVCYSAHASLDELKAFIQYFESEEIFPCVCPTDLKDSIYSLLDKIRSKIKGQKNDVVKDEKYTLQVLNHKDIINKSWAKYYSSKSNRNNS